ncbi:unnamed protein product [Cyclocybe aegerita]|uniref:Uncharacterized protein n=1 Tax=Cyclocybe aegerita TaxID=1973307 RepID=A0A8S0WSF7_CYCAE|nr:unnamed protein product [Cyclocybe aegerita]
MSFFANASHFIINGGTFIVVCLHTASPLTDSLVPYRGQHTELSSQGFPASTRPFTHSMPPLPSPNQAAPDTGITPMLILPAFMLAGHVLASISSLEESSESGRRRGGTRRVRSDPGFVPYVR